MYHKSVTTNQIIRLLGQGAGDSGIQAIPIRSDERELSCSWGTTYRTIRYRCISQPRVTWNISLAAEPMVTNRLTVSSSDSALFTLHFVNA
jgi:hypothetical protein